jgi:pimeloyl-ACP methyl ester carboxylesterase
MASRRITQREAEDLRGLGRAMVDATTGVTDVVEQMHRTILGMSLPVGPAAPERTGGLTALVYATVRGTARLVGSAVDAGLGTLASRAATEEVADAARSARRDDLVAVLNGVYGDYLADSRNPLATPTELRHRGERLDVWGAADALPGGDRLLVLVHGLCVDERCWGRRGTDRVAALAEELGFTTLHLRYNTGRPIPESGRGLAALLEAAVQAWPVPVASVALVGHSMGGLVARSSVHAAESDGFRWRDRLDRLVTLGSPHRGSPAEQVGSAVDVALGVSPYSAPIRRLTTRRSQGIIDLRNGRVAASRDGGSLDVPLPSGVACFAAAASLGGTRNTIDDRLRGDGLVPVRSALGIDPTTPGRSLSFPKEHTWVGLRMGHLDLLDHPDLIDVLRGWLGAGAA